MRILKIELDDPAACIMVKNIGETKGSLFLLNPGMMRIYHEADPSEKTDEQKRLERMIGILFGGKE